MDVEVLINEYIQFLKNNIFVNKIEKGYEITTPFLDDNNDYIQIHIDEIKGNDILLSDDGYTISCLEDQGIKLNLSRMNMINSIANCYGTEISQNNNIIMKSTIKDFPYKKHLLIQAILKIIDINFTSHNKIISIFNDEILAFFKENKIQNYLRNLSIVGKTGFIHTYDFILAPDNNFKARYCKSINRPNKSNIMSTIFGWNETKEQVNEADLYVFLNDENKFTDELEKGLNNYDITTIKKSALKKQEIIPLYFK